MAAPSHLTAELESTGVIVPTLNAEPFLARLLPALAAQRVPRSNYLVVDSSSDDATHKLFREFGAHVETIDRSAFNHGGTRRAAAREMRRFDILVFLTQDAIPARPDAIRNLIAPFADPAIGLAYGRQLWRTEARAIERHARLRNYPGTSEVRSFEDRHRLGIKTVFCSNSFAAYRREALEAVGSFPEDALFAEDQVVSGKMLMAGWKLAYVADAPVRHSHGYSVTEEFRRYFDVGVFHARNPWLLEAFGAVEGEGFRFLRSELSYLARQEPLSIPSAIVRTFAKYAAYRAGRSEAKLANSLKERLSMAPYYWRNRRASEMGIAQAAAPAHPEKTVKRA